MKSHNHNPSPKPQVRPGCNQARMGVALRYDPKSGDGYVLWLEPDLIL